MKMDDTSKLNAKRKTKTYFYLMETNEKWLC